jgi:hypothetical protein
VNPTSKTPPGDNKVWFVLATSSEFNVMLLAGDDVVWRINMHMVDNKSVGMSPKIDDVIGVFELDIIMGLELGWSLTNSTRFNLRQSL